MYIRGYLQGSENGRVVTIGTMSPSDDGVDGHIFLTSSFVYKIPSPISKDFQAMACLSLQDIKRYLEF